MKFDASNVKVARFDSSMNAVNFAKSAEERNGNEGGNVDVIQRYKYRDKDPMSFCIYHHIDGFVSSKAKSPLDLCFTREVVNHFLPYFHLLNVLNNHHI